MPVPEAGGAVHLVPGNQIGKYIRDRIFDRIMQGSVRAVLVIGLVLVLVQSVPAFTVSPITIDPSGSLTPGTLVIITGRIDFNPSAGTTYDNTRAIQISTSLESAQWTCAVIGGTGSEIYPGGAVVNNYPRCPWDISSPFYPKEDDKPIKFTLTGTAPDVTRTMNFTLFRVCEQDNHYSVVPGSCFERTAVVLYVWELRDKIKSVETNLLRFRSDIDEKAVLGIDTAEAEARYSEADQHLKSSCIRCGSYLEAFENTEQAEAAIAEGELLLDRAWAEKEIADAGQQLSRADAMIGWFKVNSSTANLVGLQPIVAKRDQAKEYLSIANNEILTGNYSLARSNATLAYETANESYNNGEKFRIGVDSCTDYFGPYADCSTERTILITGAGTIALVLLVAGIYWWKKRKGAKPE